MKLYTTTDDGQFIIQDIALRCKAIGANAQRMGLSREEVAEYYGEQHQGLLYELERQGKPKNAAFFLEGFDNPDQVDRPEEALPVFNYDYLESALTAKIYGRSPDLIYLGRAESEVTRITTGRRSRETSFLWTSKTRTFVIIIVHHQSWSVEGDHGSRWAFHISFLASPSFERLTRRQFLPAVIYHQVQSELFPTTAMGDPRRQFRVMGAGSLTGRWRNLIEYSTTIETQGSFWCTKSIAYAVSALMGYLNEYLPAKSAFPELPYQVRRLLEHKMAKSTLNLTAIPL